MSFFKNARFSIRPEAPIVRRALSMAVAVFAAVFIDRFYSDLQAFWVPIMTILVVQTSVHMNLRQILERVLVIIVTVATLSFVSGLIQQSFLLEVWVVLVFGAGYIFHNAFVLKGNKFSVALMMAIVALMMLVPFSVTASLYERMHDVVLGGIVGVVASLLVFPRRPDVDFRKGVIPVLQAYNDYLLAIAALLFRASSADNIAQQKKIRVEQVLQVQQEFFPDWVYEAGFNPELQEGHRHFLVKIEQLGQILFAMHQVARHAIDRELLQEFREPIERYVEQARNLIELFITRLNLQKIENPIADFAAEIVVLEKTYQKVIQVPLELLDTSQDYVDIAALIYDLKDFQKILLKIAEALR